MRGGTVRFQAQYLKKIRVPDPTTLDEQIAADLRTAFGARDVEKATRSAARAYNIDLIEYELTESVGASA